jgi:hypothetical protein
MKILFFLIGFKRDDVPPTLTRRLLQNKKFPSIFLNSRARDRSLTPLMSQRENCLQEAYLSRCKISPPRTRGLLAPIRVNPSLVGIFSVATYFFLSLSEVWELFENVTGDICYVTIIFTLLIKNWLKSHFLSTFFQKCFGRPDCLHLKLGQSCI